MRREEEDGMEEVGKAGKGESLSGREWGGEGKGVQGGRRGKVTAAPEWPCAG